MKKIKIILIVLTSITLMQFSCSKSDEQITPEYSIFKKWYNKEQVINGVVEAYDGHEACGKDYIEFYDNNKVKQVDITLCEPVINMMGTFTKQGNTLTIVDDLGDSITYEIITLNDTSFSIKYNDGGDVIEERFTNN